MIQTLERLNRQIEDDRLRAVRVLEQQVAELDTERRKAATEAARLDEEVKQSASELAARTAALEAALAELTQLRGHVEYLESVQRVQAPFPVETRRGRGLRKILRRIL